MVATFVVEDGSGVSTANSYITLALADQYDEDHDANATWQAASDANKQKALRLSTQYLDAEYSSRWLGERTNRDQALDWPRRDITDKDNFIIDSASMPQALLDACVEAAIISVGGEDLMPNLTNPGTIKRKMVKAPGPIVQDITYMGGNSPIKVYRIIDNLLTDLITAAGSGEIIRS